MSKAWIGVDLDGTLAIYTHWKGPDEIGAPIPRMVSRVKELLTQGQTVKIFTARVCLNCPDIPKVEAAIKAWCKEHIGQELEVTCMKDWDMLEFYDDRAVQVEPNTGRILADFITEFEQV